MDILSALRSSEYHP